MIKNKKRLYFLVGAVVVFCTSLYAVVFEVPKKVIISASPKLLCSKISAISARINSKPLKIESYKGVMSADSIMSYYSDKAEQSGAQLINGGQVKAIASMLLFSIEKETPNRWYYLFYAEKSGDLTLVAAGDYKAGSGMIIVSIDKEAASAKGGGYDDSIKHYQDSCKELSVEILSGINTSGFANFYKISGASKRSVRNYYENYFLKNKWRIKNRNFSEETDTFMVEKNGKVFVMNIKEGEDGDNWISVMG